MRTVLAASIKHSFWILCGIIAVVCLGTWLYITSSLRSDIKNNRTGIEGEFTKAEEIKRRGVEAYGETIHPNEVTRQNVDLLLTDFNESVQAAWKLQYERQGDIFVWPDSLEPAFLAKVQDMRPIEAKIEFPTPTTREVSIQYRTDYKNFTINELPKLADTIGAVWDPQQGRTSAGGGPDGGIRSSTSTSLNGRGPRSNTTDAEGEFPRERAIVDWDAASQSELLASHFAWTQDETQITTLDMLYAQEDFWVLTSVFQIIKDTNGDADARHNAAVKRIEYLQLGREAMSPTGRNSRGGPSGSSSSSGPSGSSGGYGSAPSYGASSGTSTPPSGGGSTSPPPPSALSGPANSSAMVGSAASLTADPAEGRYVDTDYKPLPASRLRAAIRTDSPKPEDAYLRVAKRMPIRLGLVIDQRKLPALLAACANAPLTLEVRQVRLNPESGGSSGSGGGGGGTYSSGGGGGGGGTYSSGGGGFTGDGGSDSRGAIGVGRGAPGGSGSLGSSQASSDQNLGPFTVKVEIYGIVYIYNPPADLEKLEVDAGSSALAAAGPGTPMRSTPTSPPAAVGARVQ